MLVDDRGRPIGAAGKSASHHANTPLHLAFSCYVFDDDGAFLATRRALPKKVWPGVWTNSVCGHPGVGESIVDAIHRRLDYELGMRARDIQVLLPRHIYRTPPFRGIVEHEFCPVYIARAASDPQPNPLEVGACAWMDWQHFVRVAETDTTDTCTRGGARTSCENSSTTRSWPSTRVPPHAHRAQPLSDPTRSLARSAKRVAPSSRRGADQILTLSSSCGITWPTGAARSDVQEALLASLSWVRELASAAALPALMASFATLLRRRATVRVGAPRSRGMSSAVEGGVTVILTLMILFGVIVGGVALFGAGGFVRRREMKGELDDDEPRGRPTHTPVEDDSRDVQFPREPSSRTQGPE